MILAVDIGNTRTRLAGFRKPLIEGHLTSREQTDDEIWAGVRNILEQRVKQVEGVVIASVVPALTAAYVRMSRKFLGKEPVIISGALEVGLQIKYEAAALGADRIAAAVAAFAKYGGPVIVADFGTASTYDAISKKGEFLGGVIAPGVGTSAAELFRRGALLPEVAFKYPENILGTGTVEAMQSGIMFGAVEAADGMIRRIKRILGKHAIVVATGGFSKVLAEMSNEIRYVEPLLVLEGARLIYERVRKSAKRPGGGRP